MRPDLEWRPTILTRSIDVGGDRRLIRVEGERAVIEWGVRDQYGNAISTRYEVTHPRDPRAEFVCEQYLQRGGVARMRSGSVLGRGPTAGVAKSYAEEHARREGPRILRRFAREAAHPQEIHRESLPR